MKESAAEREVRHWMTQACLPEQGSVADLIADVALTHPSTSVGEGCAGLYLALTGGCVPIKDIWPSFDDSLRAWMMRGFKEHLTGRWCGSYEALQAIRKVHPGIWQQSQTALNAWKTDGAR